MKKSTCILLTIILALLLNWGFALVKCEILTAKYGDQALYSACIEQTMIEEDSSFKVLECEPAVYARVYAKGANTSHELILICDQDSHASNPWKVVIWNTIWSKSGSADGFIWPYFR